MLFNHYYFVQYEKFTNFAKLSEILPAESKICEDHIIVREFLIIYINKYYF